MNTTPYQIEGAKKFRLRDSLSLLGKTDYKWIIFFIVVQYIDVGLLLAKLLFHWNLPIPPFLSQLNRISWAIFAFAWWYILPRTSELYRHVKEGLHQGKFSYTSVKNLFFILLMVFVLLLLISVPSMLYLQIRNSFLFTGILVIYLFSSFIFAPILRTLGYVCFALFRAFRHFEVEDAKRKLAEKKLQA